MHICGLENIVAGCKIVTTADNSGVIEAIHTYRTMVINFYDYQLLLQYYYGQRIRYNF